MSVVVAAAPISLMAALGHIIPLLAVAASGTIATTAVNIAAVNALYGDYKESNPANTSNSAFHINEDCFNKIFNKELKTNIMDKETLLKTLNEYGADIIEDSGETIICMIDSLKMKFTRQAQSEPFNLYIEYHSKKKLNAVINELDEEYKSNVQDISYNQIMKNLEEKNLSIEEEEILEDNTIVLTVNIE